MTEPDVVTRSLLALFGGGTAVWVAGGLLLAVVVLDARGVRRIISVGTAVSIGLATVAAWPAHWGPWIVGGLTLGWLMARRASQNRPRPAAHSAQALQTVPTPAPLQPPAITDSLLVSKTGEQRTGWSFGSCPGWRWAVVVAIIVSLADDFRWRFTPTVRLSADDLQPEQGGLAILGDSLSAGLNETDPTWPKQFATRYGVTVWDASAPGAVTADGMAQLQALADRGSILLIELGGNDVLEYQPVTPWATACERLLQSATERYSRVVMFELPLPPGGGTYGVIQRRLAKQYRVPLIPKWRLMEVLTTAGATTDGIHPAPAGHTALAQLIAEVLDRRPLAPGEPPGAWQRIRP